MAGQGDSPHLQGRPEHLRRRVPLQLAPRAPAEQAVADAPLHAPRAPPPLLRRGLHMGGAGARSAAALLRTIGQAQRGLTCQQGRWSQHGPNHGPTGQGWDSRGREIQGRESQGRPGLTGQGQARATQARAGPGQGCAGQGRPGAPACETQVSCSRAMPRSGSNRISLTRPQSMTQVTSSMVMEVSATLVATTTLTAPGAGRESGGGNSRAGLGHRQGRARPRLLSTAPSSLGL